MFACLERLRTNGYSPRAILDVGAHKGFWTEEAKRVYPHADYFLFEPIPYPELAKYPNVFPVILDSEQREVDWYERQNTGDSMFKERTVFFQDCRPVKRQTTTLSDVLGNRLHGYHSLLLKIDCQGAEIPILKGAKSVLEKADFVLLELPFFGQYNERVAGFEEHIRFMNELGYVPYDLADVNYRAGFLVQIDMLFMKKGYPFAEQVQERLMFF